MYTRDNTVFPTLQKTPWFRGRDGRTRAVDGDLDEDTTEAAITRLLLDTVRNKALNRRSLSSHKTPRNRRRLAPTVHKGWRIEEKIPLISLVAG